MAGHSRDISSAYDAAAVTPDDNTVIPTVRGLFIGTGGNLAVRMASGNTVTFANASEGIFTIQVDKVLSTGTTATGIIALY